MKSSAKHFGLAVGLEVRQHEPKWSWNYFTHDVSHKKIRNPQPKNFYQVQSTRLVDPFEPLNISLAQLAEELGRW